MKKIRWYYWLIGVVLLIVIAASAFTIWASSAADPMPEALNALQSDEKVQVETEPWLVFTPQDAVPTIGLVFYPGGKVDPRAYAPAARAIASQGYLVVIPPMPLNLAVFAPNRASDVVAAYPEIKCWVVGGHSLGGSMAAQATKQLEGEVSGLLLWASYPAESLDLSESSLESLTISASEDGLSTPDKIQNSLERLPGSTEWVVIEGGNHAGFGWYGEQSGDGEARISREEQQEQIINKTTAWLGNPELCQP